MIEIKNLSKHFGEKQIFNKFNYTIEDNSMIAIVGKSGCGKSTLLNILGLLDNDYQGEIFYNHEPVSRYNEKKKNEYIRNNINYLFQNYALIDDETVENNLLLALEYQKLSKNEKYKKIENALSMVGLSNYNAKKVYTLSGGEQQRVALARVILKQGDIILADEPTGNLDEKNSQMVMEILKELQKEGKTIIIVTHNDQIAQQCDKVINI